MRDAAELAPLSWRRWSQMQLQSKWQAAVTAAAAAARALPTHPLCSFLSTHPHTHHLCRRCKTQCTTPTRTCFCRATRATALSTCPTAASRCSSWTQTRWMRRRVGDLEGGQLGGCIHACCPAIEGLQLMHADKIRAAGWVDGGASGEP